jgi:two-component system CheB/CheR fusion protein
LRTPPVGRAGRPRRPPPGRRRRLVWAKGRNPATSCGWSGIWPRRAIICSPSRSTRNAANEELQAANEEGQSANEELQSLNEELETSKEELESTNEELTTVNEEMANRNAELNVLNSDLANFQSSTRLVVVLLGRDLTIRRFSTQAEKQFHLRASDLGRPIADVRHHLDMPDLEAVIAGVIAEVRECEREVQDQAGRWHSLRVRPYLTQ